MLRVVLYRQHDWGLQGQGKEPSQCLPVCQGVWHSFLPLPCCRCPLHATCPHDKLLSVLLYVIAQSPGTCGQHILENEVHLCVNCCSAQDVEPYMFFSLFICHAGMRMCVHAYMRKAGSC